MGYNLWSHERVGHNLVTKQQQYTYTTCIWEGEKLRSRKGRETMVWLKSPSADDYAEGGTL